MRCAIVVSLIVSLLGKNEHTRGQERRIVSLKAIVVAAREKSLELIPADPNTGVVLGKSIHFDIAGDSRFEEVDFKVVNEQLTTTRKAISLGDLVPTQPIDIIALFADTRATVLFGVVASGSVSGRKSLTLIAKLGGTVRNFGGAVAEKSLEVNLSNSALTDDGLEVIALLDDISTLNLSDTKITDKGVAHLAGHPKLRYLILSGTKVTGDVLKHLDTMPKLEDLSVDRTAIARDAILRFAANRRLHSICQISTGPSGEYRIHEQLRDDGRGGPTPYVYLMKHATYYGRFYTQVQHRRKATTYYHRNGPVGAVLRRFEHIPQNTPEQTLDGRLPASVAALSAFSVGGIPMDTLANLWSEPAIGVIELNAGTIAAYGRPFQTIDFYDDLPELVAFNVSPRQL